MAFCDTSLTRSNGDGSGSFHLEYSFDDFSKPVSNSLLPAEQVKAVFGGTPSFKRKVYASAIQTVPHHEVDRNGGNVLYEIFRVLLVGALYAVFFRIKVSPENERMFYWSTLMFGTGLLFFVNAGIQYGQCKRQQLSILSDSAYAVRERIAIFNLPMAYLIFFAVTQEILKRM